MPNIGSGTQMAQGACTAAWLCSVVAPPSVRSTQSASVVSTTDAGRSAAMMVSQAGAAETAPLPVCRRNFLVVVMFPASLTPASAPEA